MGTNVFASCRYQDVQFFLDKALFCLFPENSNFAPARNPPNERKGEVLVFQREHNVNNYTQSQLPDIYVYIIHSHWFWKTGPPQDIAFQVQTRICPIFCSPIFLVFYFEQMEFSHTLLTFYLYQCVLESSFMVLLAIAFCFIRMILTFSFI